MTTAADPSATTPSPSDFIRDIVATDLADGKHEAPCTRFPPEPNGYLHIGHAKSICLNFGIAEENEGGRCNLRFDDTNPVTEDMEYVAAIEEDVRWLGYDWGDRRYFASDYFERLYELAERLIEKGLAYVDSLDEEAIREHRGTITEPGRDSPYRERPVAENLDLFRRMRAGEFADGAHVLRARIDMSHANMKMRDPLLYRIRHEEHYRRGDTWCIYPMYDFTHGLSDAFEGITHSLCTLEFENNRELYDWILEALDWPRPRPRQIEFARLQLSYTVLSKRKLLTLVKGGHVDGWDDPRMPTLSGLRNRGVPASAIRSFCDRIGVAKANSVVDVALLEHSIRDDLNTEAPRVLAVLRPLKLVVTNYPEGEVEWLDAPYWPHDVPKEGSRKIPFSRELFIEADDFDEDPPKGYRRLAPGREIRLRYGYFVRCDEVVKDETGEVTELRCSYDPETRSGAAPDGRKPLGTIHWVSAPHSRKAEVRLYDRLFADPQPDRGKGGPDFLDFLNPDSLEVLADARVEPSLAEAEVGSRWQLERQGYFVKVSPEAGRRPPDGRDRLVFHRIVALKDTWERRNLGAAEQRDSSRRRDIGTSGHRDIGISGHRDIGTSGHRDVGTSGRRGLGASGPRNPWEGVTAEQREAMERLVQAHGIEAADARVLAESPERLVLFEEAVEVHPANPQGIANWIVNELLGLLGGDAGFDSLQLGGEHLGELVSLIDRGVVSTKIAKEVLAEMTASGRSPVEIVQTRGLVQISDHDALAAIADEILAAHPEELAAYRAGKTQLLGFFMGRLMQATEGKANPEVGREVLQERLGRQINPPSPEPM